MKSFKTRSVALVLAGCCAGLVLSGCKASVPIIGATVGPTIYYTATAFPQGPQVQFVNDSSIPVAVRYWVGRRDVTVAGGVADIRTGDDMTFVAEPGDHFITGLGRSFWPTGNTDGVVWMRVDAGAAGALDPVWLQLEHPAPYTVRVTGESPSTLVFTRDGEAGMTPLPRDRWIMQHNGPFPVASR